MEFFQLCSMLFILSRVSITISHGEVIEHVPIGKHRIPERLDLVSILFSPGGADFYKRYIVTHKPVLVKGAASHWPLVNGQWQDLNYVNEIFSNEQLPVIEDNELKVASKLFGKIVEFKMRVNTDIPSNSRLLQGFHLPLLLQCNELVSKISSVRLQMNNKMERNLLFVKNDVLIVPFSTALTVFLFATNGTLSAETFKSVDCENVDLKKYPSIMDVPYQVVETLPGDVLYIPAYTWYHIISTDKVDLTEIHFKTFDYDFNEDKPYTQALQEYKTFLDAQPKSLDCEHTKVSIKDALNINFDDEESIMHLRIPRRNKRPEDIVLASGYKMPVLGLGTALLNESTTDAVKYALSIGYRMIDTAYGYPGSEVAITKAISESSVKREEVFIVTKLHPKFLGYHETEFAIDESLNNLNTSYIDLYLIHSTFCDDFLLACKEGEPHGTWKESWRAMEEAVKQGKIRSIGVSNFVKDEILELLRWSELPVSVVQNWFDPFNQDVEIRDVCNQYNIRYMGYSTLGSRWKLLGLSYNPVMESDLITALAGHYDYVMAHVVLRWAIHVNVTVIPRSASHNHIAQNLRSLDISLYQADIDSLNELNEWMNDLANSEHEEQEIDETSEVDDEGRDDKRKEGVENEETKEKSDQVKEKSGKMEKNDESA